MSIRLLKGGLDWSVAAFEEEKLLKSSDLVRCESAVEEFLDSAGRNKHKMKITERKDKMKRKERNQKRREIFKRTLLRLGPFLSVASLPHIVLCDVLPGCQSPQRVSGALSPTGRAHRPPVLCYC